MSPKRSKKRKARPRNIDFGNEYVGIIDGMIGGEVIYIGGYGRHGEGAYIVQERWRTLGEYIISAAEWIETRGKSGA